MVAATQELMWKEAEKREVSLEKYISDLDAQEQAPRQKEPTTNKPPSLEYDEEFNDILKRISTRKLPAFMQERNHMLLKQHIHHLLSRKASSLLLKMSQPMHILASLLGILKRRMRSFSALQNKQEAQIYLHQMGDKNIKRSLTCLHGIRGTCLML